MMDKLRAGANSLPIKIIFAIIILAFIFTGVGGFLGFSSSNNDEKLYIAKVNEVGVGREAFETEFKIREQNDYTIGKDERYIKALRKSLLLEKLTSILYSDLADNLNLSVSDSQVKADISSNPVFFSDGEFDNSKYLALLNLNGFTPDVYAENIRSFLQKKQLLNALNSGFELPLSSELENILNEERTVYFANYDATNLMDKNKIISDDEAYAYYEANKNRYIAPRDVVKLNIVNFDLLDTFNALSKNISDEELKKFYENNLKKYTEPRLYSYSMIEFQDEDAANNVFDELSQGASFTEKAKEHYVYPIQKESSGFIGWFSQDNVPQAILQLKLTPENNLSSPVKLSDNSFAIFKLNEVKEPKILSLSQVLPKVRSDLIDQKISVVVNEKKQILADMVQRNLTLNEISEELGIPINVTGPLPLTAEEITDPSVNSAVLDALYQQDKWSNVLGPVFLPKLAALYVFNINNFVEQGEIPFERALDDITDELRYINAKKELKNEVDEILKELNSSGRSDKLLFRQQLVVKRDSKDIDKDIVDSIFNSPKPIGNERHYDVSFDYSKGRAVFFTIVNTSVSSGEKNEKSFISYLNDDIRALTKQLESQAKIEIMPNANL